MEHETVEYDVAIVGSGPGGLQAALHAAKRKVSVAVLGKLKKSSLTKAHLDNYCCMDSKMVGEDMLDAGKRQAENAGAVFHQEDVMAISQEDDNRYRLELETGKSLVAKALILAMGISRNRLNKPGEKEFIGKGVSYCVDCDGGFFIGQKVAVVGNESAAAHGAMTMLLIAEKVHLIVKEWQIDESLKNQVEQSDIVVHSGRWVKAIEGDGGVKRLVLDNGEVLEVSGVFIELGAKGALGLAATLGVALDPEKYQYIVTDQKQKTNVPGIFAAGDICGPPWQVAKAVGQGCVAGLEAATYAKKA
jgi:thioredoxin reductase (NADPH)